MDDAIMAAARRAWLSLAERAMDESWRDRESWEAAKAAIGDLGARYGADGTMAFSLLEAKLYRLFVHGSVAEEIEWERAAKLRASRG